MPDHSARVIAWLGKTLSASHSPQYPSLDVGTRLAVFFDYRAAATQS